jgi:outer membrane receptor protein involved in Fe transport
LVDWPGSRGPRPLFPHTRFTLRHLVGLTLLWLLAPAVAHAAAVRGGFVERGTRTPLPGVQIVIRGGVDSIVVAHALTDEDGRFQVDGLKAGRYVLRAGLLGHVPFVRPDVILTDGAPVLDLGTQALAVSPIAIKPVEVSTARASAVVGSDRTTYLTKDLPAATTGTTLDLLRAVPELDVDINDKVSLRGSSGVTIQINGRTSPLKGDALAAFLRQFPATRIERVEVIANPSAKFDPEGVAGIVNLVTRDAFDLGLSGSVYVGLGDRGRGPSTRVAWQQGRTTLYGGVSGYWSRLEYRYDDLRQNLLAHPPSAYRLSSITRNRSGFGSMDGSFEFALDKRSTLYGSATGYLNATRTSGGSGYVLSDSAGTVTSSYDRTSEARSQWRSGTATLGVQHVVEKNRNEWSAEWRHTDSPSTRSTDAVQHVFIPADSTGQVSWLGSADGSRERSIQIDDTHPLGPKGKLELGYRGAERRTTNSSALGVASGSAPPGASDYVHREVFQSGYVTAGSTFGRLSLQAGVRAEAAHTTFDVIPRATRYGNDYRSAFPSANVAWDFGAGRTLRMTYSKRIERPSPGYLNPDVPTFDVLNRAAGNPYLAPKYTHAWALEASWTGSRGLLKLSPFLRQTIHNWDQFKRVDSTGAAVTTWLNAASIRFTGGSLVASLRQTGRLGGTMSVSVYREQHDASNFSTDGRHAATNWSADGNVTLKATRSLDLQGWLRYNPAQTLAQGRISASLYTNVGVRLKLGEQAWASASVNDPFNVWRYTFVSRDTSYVQTSTNRGTIRRFGVALGWSWGRPPEAKTRRPAEEPPRQDPPETLH